MFEIFRSIEDVWVAWLISVFIVGYCLWRALNKSGWKGIRKFSADETGASYVLPYMLSFPIFLLLMAVMIQSTFMIMVKIGTMYATHSAARTYIVWQGLEPQVMSLTDGTSLDYIRYKTHRAATMAMTPFANSNSGQRKRLFPMYPTSLNDNLSMEKGAINLPESLANLLSVADRNAYAAVYDRLIATANKKDTGYVHAIIKQPKLKARASYLRRKYAYAAAATRVTTPNSLVAWNQPVEIRLRYRMGFHIPGTALFFRGKQPNWTTERYRDIETTVVLPSEAAETPNGKIGIPYDNIFLF